MMSVVIVLVIIAASSLFQTNVASSQNATSSNVLNLEPPYAMPTLKQAPIKVRSFVIYTTDNYNDDLRNEKQSRQYMQVDQLNEIKANLSEQSKQEGTKESNTERQELLTKDAVTTISENYKNNFMAEVIAGNSGLADRSSSNADPVKNILKNLFNSGSKAVSRILKDIKDSGAAKELTLKIGQSLLEEVIDDKGKNQSKENNLLDFLMPRMADVAQNVLKDMNTTKTSQGVTAIMNNSNNESSAVKPTQDKLSTVDSESFDHQETNPDSNLGNTLFNMAQNTIGQLGSMVDISSQDTQNFVMSSVLKPVLKGVVNGAFKGVLGLMTKKKRASKKKQTSFAQKRNEQLDSFTQDRLIVFLNHVLPLLENIFRQDKDFRRGSSESPTATLMETLVQAVTSESGKAVARPVARSVVRSAMQFPYQLLKNVNEELKKNMQSAKQTREHQPRYHTTLAKLSILESAHTTEKPRLKHHKKHHKHHPTGKTSVIPTKTLPFESFMDETVKRGNVDYIGWIIGLSMLSVFAILGVLCKIICWQRKKGQAYLY